MKMHDNMLVRKIKASKNKSIQEGSGVGGGSIQSKGGQTQSNPMNSTQPDPIQSNPI